MARAEKGEVRLLRASHWRFDFKDKHDYESLRAQYVVYHFKNKVSNFPL